MSEAATSLANTGPLPARLLRAQDPATPPAQLEALGTGPNSRAIKEAVACNPNTPPELLLQLAGRYWQSFLDNPVLPLLLLEDPGLPHRLPLRVLRALVRREGVPPLILQTLARHPDREVRESAKFHVDHPADDAPAAGAAALGWPAALRRELEKLPAQRATLPELLDLDVVPAWLLEAVAGTSNGALRAAVIASSKRPDASPALRHTGALLRRSFGEWQTVIHQYSWGPSEHRQLTGQVPLPEAEVERLAQGSPAWQVQAARSASLGTATLERLARSPLWRVGSALARHPRLTLGAAMQLVARADPRVLRSLAQSRYAPPTLLPNLARSADAGVRRGVARHRHTPPATLALLAADADASVRRAVAQHRNLPYATLSALVADPDPDVRIRAAHSRNCDLPLFEQLATDADLKVREHVARRIGLPPALIRRFLDDPEKDVRHAAALNYGTPRHIVDFMQECAMGPPAERPPLPDWGNGKGWYYRTGPAEPRLDVDDKILQSRLYQGTATEAEEDEAAVRAARAIRAAVAHQTARPALLAQLVEDPEKSVRQSVAGNINTPFALLQRLARDPSKRVRAGVANNSRHTAPELPALLGTLAQDPEAAVRGALAINRLVPPEVIDALARDESKKVRSSVPFNPAAATATLLRLLDDPRSTANMRRGIFIHEHTPAEVLLAHLDHLPESLLDDIAGNPNLPADALQRLADQHLDRLDVRRALAGNPNTPPEVLARIWALPADCRDYSRRAVGTHANAPLELLRQIVADPDSHTASGVRDNPHFSAELFRDLLPFITSKQTKQYFTYDKDVPDFVFEVLAETGDEEMLRTVAGANAPIALLESLVPQPTDADLRYNKVAYQLAGNAHVTPAILQRLLDNYAALDAKNGPQWWYYLIAANPQATPEVLSNLVARMVEVGAGTRRRSRLARLDHGTELNLILNPRLPPEHLPHFAEHPAREVRYALLQRPDCPADLRAQMRRGALRRNLENGTSVLGRASALADAATSAEWLTWLHPKAGWVERLAMIQNPNLPPDLLAVLAQDAHRLVRAAARQRQQTGQVPDLLGNEQ